jgi:hypothetical protein
MIYRSHPRRRRILHARLTGIAATDINYLWDAELAESVAELIDREPDLPHAVIVATTDHATGDSLMEISTARVEHPPPGAGGGAPAVKPTAAARATPSGWRARDDREVVDAPDAPCVDHEGLR